GPTPGSWPSSSIRSWTTPSYTSVLSRPVLAGAGLVLVGPALIRGQRLAEATGLTAHLRRGEPGHAGETGQARTRSQVTEAARERAHHVGLQIAEGVVGVATGGQHQVGDRLRALLGVARVDSVLGDRDVDELTLPVDRDGDQAASGGAVDL